jgi:hypothetical protein
MFDHAQQSLLSNYERNERSQTAVLEMQSQLKTTLTDKRDIEMEYINLKKNYNEVKSSLDLQRRLSSAGGGSRDGGPSPELLEEFQRTEEELARERAEKLQVRSDLEFARDDLLVGREEL